MADTTEKPLSDTTRQEARSLGDEVRGKGAEAAQMARDTAGEYANRARDEAYARGEEYRDYAASETGKVASALRKASEDLRAGSPQERFVGQMADGVADAADRMRGMSLEEIARDSSEFARRHPAAFLGGAALVGFAAARFLKASAQADDDDYYQLPATSRDSALASSEPIPAPATRPIDSGTGPAASGPATGVTTSTAGGAAGATGGIGSSGAASQPGGGGTTTSPSSGTSSTSPSTGTSSTSPSSGGGGSTFGSSTGSTTDTDRTTGGSTPSSPSATKP
jgi:hypothetical protein